MKKSRKEVFIGQQILQFQMVKFYFTLFYFTLFYFILFYIIYFSLACRDLIKRMLKVDKDSRIKLQEVLNHPWVNETYPIPPREFAFLFYYFILFYYFFDFQLTIIFQFNLVKFLQDSL